MDGERYSLTSVGFVGDSEKERYKGNVPSANALYQMKSECTVLLEEE